MKNKNPKLQEIQINSNTKVVVYNETKYPISLLSKFCREGFIAQKLNKKKGTVVVYIKKAGTYIRGNYDTAFGFNDGCGNFIRCQLGLITITLPSTPSTYVYHDSIQTAQLWWKVLLHEFAHAYDWHNGGKFAEYNRHWKNRPHEKKAVQLTKQCLKKLEGSTRNKKIQDLILDLAIKFEEK